MSTNAVPVGLDLEPGEIAISTLRPGPPWTLVATYVFTLGLAHFWLRAKSLTLTDRRVVVRAGVLNRSQRVVPVSMVQDVNVRTTWFGTGVVALTTAGGALSLEAFSASAAEAQAFGAAVMRAAHSQRRDSLARVPDESDGILKLRELARLRDDGVISPADFEAKKAELLRAL